VVADTEDFKQLYQFKPQDRYHQPVADFEGRAADYQPLLADDTMARFKGRALDETMDRPLVFYCEICR
jgi:transaldolase